MSDSASGAAFLRRALIVLALAIGTLAVWKLRRVEFLLFGAILFSVFLTAVAEVLSRWLRLPRGLAVGLGALGFVALFLGAIGFFGFRIEAQLAQLIQSLPSAWADFRRSLQGMPGGAEAAQALDRLQFQPKVQTLLHLRGYAMSTGEALLSLLLVIVAGIYLAAQPNAYHGGLMRLIPEDGRARFDLFLRTCQGLLRRWLMAQAVAMAVIGVLTGLGLWAIGVPAPGALGVLAGLAEFVPLIGVLIASAPAVLLALTHGWSTLAWTVGLLIAVHQFEGNVLQPLLQRGMVAIPPVLSLFALVGFGAFFGILGIVFAAPLTIVCLSAVRVLVLGEGDETSRREIEAAAAEDG